MNQKVSETYILTPLELNLLIAGKNITNIIGLQQRETQIEETAVCYAMNSLYEQQLIRNAEKGVFQVEPELADILDGIAKARFLIFIRGGNREKNSRIIYFGTKIVCVEQSRVDESAVKLYTLGKKEPAVFISEWIEEEPLRIYQKIPDEEELLVTVLNKSNILEENDWEKLQNVMGILEGVNCRNRQVVKRLVFYQGEKEKQFIYTHQGKMKKGRYDKTQWIAIVEDIVKEEAYDIG